MTRTFRKLLLLHLPANAILLWLAYQWLAMSEATVVRLAGSALVALFVLAMATCLHGATFAAFRGTGVDLMDAFKTALRHLLPLFVVALAALIVYGFLAWWSGYSVTPASNLASWLTFRLRKPVHPATVIRIFNAILWMLRWVMLPIDLLPLFSGVAARGWSGFREYGWRRHSRLYRLEIPLLVIGAIWIPLRLVSWVPHVDGFSMEMTSFVVRVVVAYLLFVGGAVTMAFLTSRGRPLESQLKTAVTP